MTSVNSEAQVVSSAVGRHLFVTDGSRIYDITGGDGEADLASLLAQTDGVGLGMRRIDGTPLVPPPLQTLTLNVAAACNMGCGYCYASGGDFGGRKRLMSIETARTSVERLIAEASPAMGLVVGFMGGEPFLARRVVHETVAYARRRGTETGHKMQFSLTTNGTLLNAADVELLAENAFHVSISIDGPREVQDHMRPLKSGASGYEAILRTLELMERRGRPRHLSARATVTPRTPDIAELVTHLVSLGFDSVGVSPVLVSPAPGERYGEADFGRLLAAMIATAEIAKSAILAGRRYPFSNFETALHELDRGSHRPYPCGAGAAYLSVNADGELYACHRFIDDPSMHMGHVETGSNMVQRAALLADRHVDKQEPCRSCWARYLCGGGCHHEVLRRGRVACDYIRGWLSYCIGAYAEIQTQAPGYFVDPDRHFYDQLPNTDKVVP